MAQATLSTISALLKRRYTPLFSTHINQNTPFLTVVKNLGSQQVSGEGSSGDMVIYHPFITGTPQGIVTTGEAGTFPTAGSSTSVEGSMGVTYKLSTIGFSGQSIAAASSNTDSFVRTVDNEMKQLKLGLDKEMHIECMTRRDGVRGRINETATNAVLVLDNTEVTGPGNRWFEDGMAITSFSDLTRATEGTNINGDVVSTVDLDDRANLNLSASSAVDDNYFVTRDGLTASIDEATGIMDWLDNTSISGSWSWFGWGAPNDLTVWGQTRSTYPSLQSNVIHNSNVVRTLDDSLIRQAADAIRNSQGLAEGSYFLIANPETTTAYLDIQDAKQQFHNIDSVPAGIQGFTVGNVGMGRLEWIVDHKWPPGTIGMINPGCWKLHEARESGFEDHGTGSIFKPAISSSSYTDALEVNHKHYWNLACYHPRKNALIADIDTNA